MKTKVACIFLFFYTFLFAQDFFLKTTKDITLTKFSRPAGVLLANTIIKADNFAGGSLEIEYEGMSFYIEDLTSIVPLTTKNLFDKSILTDIFDDNINTWIDIRYYEPLVRNDRSVLLHFFPYLNSSEYQWANEVNGYVPEWYERMLTIAYHYTWGIYNCLISDLSGWLILPVVDISKEQNTFIVRVYKFQTLYDEPYMSDKLNYDWSKIPKKEMFNLILMIDGDYMDIYIENTDTHFATLVHVSKSSVEQLDKLIQENTCDLSNITRPRRADKAHSVGATCVVAESLRLRKEENTSSATIQIMQPGTQVQILQLGKKQTIDGISANWVQVEVSVSTSVQGTDVRRATGWCFGGYLVEK